MHAKPRQDAMMDHEDGHIGPLTGHTGPLTDPSESLHSSIASESGHATEDEPYDEGIAKQESRAVGRFKLAVLIVLVVSTILVATIVHHSLERAEDESFRTAFNHDSHKILEAVGTSLDASLSVLDSIAVLFVSSARRTNQTWPFVTMPDFAMRVAKVLPLTDAICVNVVPIVTAENRQQWEAYSIENDVWVNESMSVQEQWKHYRGPIEYHGLETSGTIHSDHGDLPYNVSRDMLPNWQNFPVIPNTPWTYNTDWATVSFGEAYTTAVANHKATVSQPYMVPTPGDELEELETDRRARYYSNYLGPNEEPIEPMSDLSYPIVNDISGIETTGADDYNPAEHSVVGLIVASLYWRDVLRGILPQGSDGIQIVVSNPCHDHDFTYQINGPTVQYLGVGDLHDTTYSALGTHAKLDELDRYSTRESTYSGAPIDTGYCSFTLHLYASDVLASAHKSNKPLVFTLATVLIFAFTSLVFYFYDIVVEKRQRMVLQTAVQSSAIVSSLFPSSVRDHLYSETQSKQGNPKTSSRLSKNAKIVVRDSKGSFDSQTGVETTIFQGSPIAHLHPETTVLFADIAGFTAWSSTRQPCQVFTLLETLYAAFDEIAKQRGVFKVETIGDCYVAVVGLPTPRKAHAVVMARFAYDCKVKMTQIVSLLAETLGPGTAGLALRIGMNSGPTTAGVLRGEKSRFQLFGDTVNTASRMESNGERNRIHVSSKTAELITQAGKEHWLTLRDGHVDCKGKGLMVTYWCEPQAGLPVASDVSDTRREMPPEPAPLLEGMAQCLVDWCVDIFSGLLKEVVDARNQLQTEETIIGTVVEQELFNLILSLANLYKPNNAYHNFEHSAHVVLSTVKLLDRIQEHGQQELNGPDFGDTRGLCMGFSDPLTRFAITFSALIRDMDHPGASQHAKDRNKFALACRGTSSAEHSSIEKAWSLLMEPQFVNLSRCLFGTARELEHFRSVVNGVMAAEDEFFGVASADDEAGTSDFNLRATIFLNYIAQAASVSHTMHHFSVYKKWNARLLTEMCEAYRCGRTFKDPSEDWYEGELWFFDNYVIPLTEKLQASGIFGSTCDDFLIYAEDNRSEWELNGRFMLAAVVEELEQCFDSA